MKTTYKKGQKFGPWSLSSFLGAGGNGEVWLCMNSARECKAIKILKRVKPKSYQRFVDETNVLIANADIDGIVPLVDSYLPENLSSETPYYVMELAKPSEALLSNGPIENKVSAVIQIAETLRALHWRQIFHRDIKPANILFYNNRFCLADFGLVQYPNKTEVSNRNEEIGAKWTMAPEMRRESSSADPAKADVYSLSKTLWIFLTGIYKGFDGQYTTESIIDLRQLNKSTYTGPIDDLLLHCTDNDPKKRPTIDEFITTLKRWRELSRSFHDRNHQQWFEIQSKLFPTSIPSRVTWESVDDIVKVLKLVCRYDNLNHLLFPNCGGLDLKDARRSFEEGCVELDFEFVHIAKPTRLIFESFNYNPEWNYFRLEVGGLSPVGKSVIKETMETPKGDHPSETDEIVRYSFEDLSELSGGEYYAYEVLANRGNYQRDYLITSKSRHVRRWLKGSFVIFGKRSMYNLISETYDGRHNTMSADEFRNYIKSTVDDLRKWNDEKETDRLILEKERAALANKRKSYIEEDIVYRCIRCGDIVGRDGDALDEFKRQYNFKVIDKFGYGVVSSIVGKCCVDKS
jgi:serine/threonine-protein kinase